MKQTAVDSLRLGTTDAQVRDCAAKLNECRVEEAQETTVVDPEAGMAAMSERFGDMGGEVYVDAEKVRESNKALG